MTDHKNKKQPRSCKKTRLLTKSVRKASIAIERADHEQDNLSWKKNSLDLQMNFCFMHEFILYAWESFWVWTHSTFALIGTSRLTRAFD